MLIAHWVASLLMIPVVGRLAISEICEDFCHCDNVYSLIDCSDEELSTFPDNIRNNTRMIVFNNNELKEITKNDFSHQKNMRYLSLVNNSIEYIEENSFLFQRKLFYLDLSGNDFGEVPVALKHLRNLKDFQMTNNQIRTLSKIPWANLSRLQRLDLSHNGILKLPVVMTASLTNLLDLRVSHNNITAIPRGQFWNASKLEHLDLSYNGIYISPSYDANYETPTASAADIVTTATDLEYVIDNMAEGIEAGSFEGLYQLTVLDLKGNQIQELTQGVLDGLDNLETLNLDSNGLRKIQDHVFDGHLSIRQLTLSNNDLSVLPFLMFEELRNLEVLDLGGNSISTLTPLINVHMFHLQSLTLSRNAIRRIPSPGFQNWFHLEELHLANNKFTHVPSFNNVTQLKILDLSYNRIRYLPTDVFQGTSMQELYLGYNRLKTLDMNTFVNLENLRILDVSGDKYICDCRIRWVSDYYDIYDWMKLESLSYTIDRTILCESPSQYYGTSLYDVLIYFESKVTCTEYIGPHRVKILLLSWGSVVAFFVVCFWTYVFFNFKRRFYVRRPRKRYLLVHNKDYTNASIPLVTGTTMDTYGNTGQQVRFRSFDSDTESLDMLNCNYDDDDEEEEEEQRRMVGDETTV